MHQLESPQAARQYVLDQRSGGRTVGIVPTMGALHDGHLSLVRLSKAKCDVTIATIFVNPTQFGPGEDLKRYPRDLEKDMSLLSGEGCDAVFTPEVPQMYPEGFSTYVQPPEVGLSLEGKHRPDHFRGVTTIVLKLFNCLPATHAFFGRKDYQQWKVIEAMVRDLDVGIDVLAGGIVREDDGLAMSSRNAYLSTEQRQTALLLSSALQKAKSAFESGQRSIDVLQAEMRQVLAGIDSNNAGVDKIDYAVIVDADNLSPIASIENKQAVALIAAWVGKTRLIDNLLLSQ